MPKNINLTGTAGTTYNLDELATSNTRVSNSDALVVQIWKWNPTFKNSHGFPNPPQPVLGQIWLSKLIDKTDPDYNILKEGE